MGKLTDVTEKGDARTSSMNVLLWVLCAASLGFSAYTSFNQTYLEDRIRHFRLLGDRVSVLEARLQSIPIQMTDQRTMTGDTSVIADPEEYDNIANVVRKLSAQVSGISRLRRDVSHLKMRRGERQAAIQQTSECMCPPGIYNNISAK